MGTTSQIHIGDTTYNVDDLLAQAESGTLYDYLETELNKLAGEAEANDLLAEVSESIEALKADFEEMIDGVEEDEDDLDRDIDGDLYEIKKDRYEEEIDELEDLISELDSTLYLAIQDVVNEYGKYHVRTNADIKFTPTIDYEDGDVVEVQATGGKAVSSDEEYDGEDFDGNGIANYQDYVAFLESQSQNDIEGDCQGVFIYLEPEDVVQNMTYANGTITVDVYNSRNGNNVTMQISGIMNDANLYFEYGNQSSFPSSVYNNLPSEVTKYMFVNEEMYSLYEQGLDRTDEDKLTFIDRYDDIKEGAADVTAEYATNPEATLPYVEQGLEIMFSYLNFESDNTTSLAEVMASYLDVLEEISDPTLKSDALVSFVMTMAKKGGQNYFQGLLGIPTLIEEIFLADETLSQNEMVACLMLETQTGASIGKFGGPEILSLTSGVSESDAASMATIGGIFFIDSESGVIQIHQEEWKNEEKTLAALEAYKQLILEIGWTADTGAVDDILSQFEQKEIIETTPVITDDYKSALSMAVSLVEEDNQAKDLIDFNLVDGLTGENWEKEVKGIINALKNSTATSFEALAQILRNEIADLPDTHDGDVIASVIAYIGRSDIGKDLLNQLFAADPTLKDHISNIIMGETVLPYHAYAANSIINPQ
jgi:hypothetical protein